MAKIRLKAAELNHLLFSLDEEGVTSSKIEEGKLKGYRIKISPDGEHLHDGQMLEYTIKFTSPKKVTTEITTLMCLMVGWNYSETVIIK
jgi:hypothetical protein